MSATIEQVCYNVLLEFSGKDNLAPTARLEDLGVRDSLDMVSLGVDLEEALGIRITNVRAIDREWTWLELAAHLRQVQQGLETPLTSPVI